MRIWEGYGSIHAATCAKSLVHSRISINATPASLGFLKYQLPLAQCLRSASNTPCTFHASSLKSRERPSEMGSSPCPRACQTLTSSHSCVLHGGDSSALSQALTQSFGNFHGVPLCARPCAIPTGGVGEQEAQGPCPYEASFRWGDRPPNR